MQDDAAGEPLSCGCLQAGQTAEVVGANGRTRLHFDTDDLARRAFQDDVHLDFVFISVVAHRRFRVGHRDRLDKFRIREAFQERPELLSIPCDAGFGHPPQCREQSGV